MRLTSILLFTVLSIGCSSSNNTNTADIGSDSETGDVDVAVDTNASDTSDDDAGDAGSPSNYREVACADHLSVPATGMRCGFIKVPQNHVRETNLEIELFMVRPENAPNDKPPVVILAGGPGAAHTDFGAQKNLPIEVTALLGREAIYYEQRGLPPSIPAPICDAVSIADTLAEAAIEYQNCKDELAQENIDVYSYNTLENAADIAAIPAALGIDKIDIFAGSYATRLAARVMERHPESVRVAVFGGVSVFGGVDLEVGTPAYLELLEEAGTAYGTRCAMVPECDAFLPGFDFETIITDLGGLIARDGSFMLAGITIQSLQQLQGVLFPMMYIAQIRNMIFSAMYHASKETSATFYSHVGEGDAAAGEAFILALLQKAQEQVFGFDALMAVTTRCYDGDSSNCVIVGDDRPMDYQPSEFTTDVGTDHPILFLSGGLDPATPTQDVPGYLPLWPNSTWSVFGCLGHDISRVSNIANGTCVAEQAASFFDDPTAPLPDCIEQTCADLPMIPDQTQLSLVLDQYVSDFEP